MDASPPDPLALLAGGEGHIDGTLRTGQRTKRLLLLHELVTAMELRAPELFDEAMAGKTFRQLADAQRFDRRAVDQVLMEPHVGAWAMHCLRRLAGDHGLTPADAGHLGAVTAAAGFRAGLDLDVAGHPNGGSLMLPTYGAVRLPSTTTWCRLRTRPGARLILVNDGATEHRVSVHNEVDETIWRPLRRLHWTSGDLTIDVGLDDIDPFRDSGVLSPSPRLENAELADWRTMFAAGWDLLVEHDPERAAAISDGIATLVPLRPTDAVSELSASRHEAIGAIALTTPRRPLSMALALVHEFQHSKLSALLDIALLARPAADRRFHAPWRRDPRPVQGLLHGTYAFLGLAQFWERYRRGAPSSSHDRPVPNAGWAHFEFALLRGQVTRALVELHRSDLLTPLGAGFVEGLRRATRVLNACDVSSLPLMFARLACHDNAVSWRLRNRLTNAGHIARLAAAWSAGRPPTPWNEATSLLVDGGGALACEPRTALFRARLAYPRTWRDEPATASAADVLLVQRRDAEAADAYRSLIDEDPLDNSSWAGLALCAGVPPSTRWALNSCPEVLRDLVAAIAHDPGVASAVIDHVAEWLRGNTPIGPIWAS